MLKEDIFQLTITDDNGSISIAVFDHLTKTKTDISNDILNNAPIGSIGYMGAELIKEMKTIYRNISENKSKTANK